MATQPGFEGPSPELRSHSGGRTGEELHMTPEQRKAAEKGTAELRRVFKTMGVMKQKELLNRIQSLHRRLPEDQFEAGLRAEMMAMGIILGELPLKQKEATSEDVKNHESSEPLAASMAEQGMEERLGMLEDALKATMDEGETRH